jgi:Bifunctional DNA primase/polymerase, N-terminal
MSSPVATLQDYAARGWPIFPMSMRKVPLTEHGLSDATTDLAAIREWGRRWPSAIPALATGEPSGVVALDVDVKPDAYGPDSLEALGVNFHPATPTSHSPSGGFHMLFQHPGPGRYIKTIAGRLGRGLDIRGDGGSLMLPPGPGRHWDPHLGPDTPLAPMPEWMVIREPEPVRATATGATNPIGELSAYCEGALDAAFRRIVEAPAGQQEQTLNKEAFGLATLVGAWGMPPALALEALHKAAGKMPSHDRRRPWRQKELDRKVTDAFAAGLRHPRERRNG